MNADLTTGGEPTKVSHLFTHQNAHPVALHHVLTNEFGVDWLIWDHSALWDEIKLTFGTIPSNLARCKVQALRTLQANELYWGCWEVAYPVIRSLNNKMPDFYVHQPPTPAQIYAAVDMINLIRKMPYLLEVKNYLAGILLSEGIYYAPPPLDFLQPILDRPYYKCDNCGQQARDVGNKICDSCGSKEISKFTGNHGSQLKSFVDAVLAGKDLEIDETPAGVHAAIWKVAKDYSDTLHERHRRQMRFVT